MFSPLSDGVYSVSYRYPADSQAGVEGLAIVRGHHIMGSDASGGLFKARQRVSTGTVTGTLRAPPDAELITGLRTGPEPSDIPFTAVPQSGDQTLFLAAIGGSEIAVVVSYVGPLPADLPIAVRARAGR